ncbi:MAG: DUF6873 family GME fold protein [Eubacteriales bacterium]
MSKNTNSILLNWLSTENYEINLIYGNENIDIPIRAHADLYMCSIAHDGSNVHHAFENPKSPYPLDVGYNAVCMGNYFIHNLKYTALDLLTKIESLNMKKINVNQGYTKCNIAVLDDSHAITSDVGIFNALKTHAPELDILLVQPKYVALDGFPYGFIGGTCGRIDNMMVFNGNLKAHPNFYDICAFVKKAGLKLKYFPQFPLTDIGSIITEVKF